MAIEFKVDGMPLDSSRRSTISSSSHPLRSSLSSSSPTLHDLDETSLVTPPASPETQPSKWAGTGSSSSASVQARGPMTFSPRRGARMSMMGSLTPPGFSTLDRLRQQQPSPVSPMRLQSAKSQKRLTIDAIPMTSAPVINALVSLSLTVEASSASLPGLWVELWGQRSDDETGSACLSRSQQVMPVVLGEKNASYTWDDDDQINLARIYLLESLQLHLYTSSSFSSSPSSCSSSSSSSSCSTTSLDDKLLVGSLELDVDILKTKQILNLAMVVKLPLTGDPGTTEEEREKAKSGRRGDLFLGFFNQQIPQVIEDTSRLSITTRISSGMYGKVWKGTLDKKTRVAVKAALPVSQDELQAAVARMIEAGELPDDFDKEDEPMLRAMLEEERVHQLLNEIDALSQLGPHPSIIQYIGSQTAKRKLYVVSGLQDGNLRSLLCAAKAQSEAGASPNVPRASLERFRQQICGDLGARLQWCCQLSSAVEFIHKQQWVHSDIKPENILYSIESGTIRLADFGFAQKIQSDADARRFGAQRKGSALYMAPEQFHALYNGQSSDVYSMAVTFWEILSLKDAFSDLPAFDDDVLQSIMDPSRDLSASIRPPLAELPPSLVPSLFRIDPAPPHTRPSSMWHPNYLLRPNARQVLDVMIKETKR